MDVLRDGLDRDRERLGQLIDRRLTVRKALEDRSPRGVGERREGPVQLFNQAVE
jgi:hypothetical protein